MANVFEVGQVDWFDDIKGFGFIKQTNREDVFVHTSNAEAGVLKAGAWVVFKRIAGKKGPSASKVQKLGADPALVETLFSGLTPLAVEAVCMVQNEGLTKRLLLWQVANLEEGGEETRFKRAEAIRRLTSKYLPAFVEEISGSILPTLPPSEQWYWWQAHCPPGAITHAVTEYFESVADIHYADPRNTFEWLQVDDGSVGVVFMHRLNAAHFDVLFRALLPRQRVAESLVGDGGELLKTRWYEADDGVGWSVEKNYRLASKRGFMLRYFAELAVSGVAELLWQHRRVVVPEPRFLQGNGSLLESEHFWELLHHDLPEINELALSGYVGKMGAVTTQRVYQDVVALLRLCAASTDTGLQAEATRQVEAVVSGPVKIKLWLEGFLPGLDVAAVLEECPTLQLENYLLEAVPPLRGPAARVLLDRAVGTGGATGIRAGLKVLFAAKQQVENEEFEQLLFVYPDASDVWLAISQWTAGQGVQPDFSVICHWLLMQDEQADGKPLAILDLLADEEQARFFHYIVEADPLRLMKLSTGLLLKWFERLPAEDKSALIKPIVQSRRKELALELWLTDLTDYYSFGDYYLHVAMLVPEVQFLFLRKTFGLIAAGKVALTVEELDAIPRHSLDDENPLNRRLDYSIDLVLKVLKALRGGGAYPTGTELIALIIDYAKGAPAQLLQFKTLFEPCLGRSVIKLDRSIEVEVAHIGTKTYEGSSDRKSVLAGGTWYEVVNGYMTFNGKRYRVEWETQMVRPWHLEKRKVDATCCEGNKATG